MQTIIGYVRKVIVFRHHKRLTFIPQYKDLGKGGVREKPASKEIKRET